MRNEWLKFMPQIEPGYAPRLHDHGSLTRRIQLRGAWHTTVGDGSVLARYIKVDEARISRTIID